MRHIDTLIFAGWVIPIEPEGVVLEQHAVIIHEGKILGILPSQEAVAEFSGRITHRLPGHVIMPGFINAHTHASMNLLRGFADDMPLMQWLQDHIWPAEQQWVSESFVMDGTRLAIAEMLRGGTTCFNDMYFFPDIIGQVAEETGIRAAIGLLVLDFPTLWANDPSDYLRRAEEVHQQYRDHPLVRTTIAPHAPYSVSDEGFTKVAEMAEREQLPIHMHVHETAKEIEDSIAKTGERPLARLDRLNLLSERFIAVHATQLNDEDKEYLLAYDAHVVHCPSSNLKLASGFCPVQSLLDLGINVAIGTDGAASNNSLDMMAEMRLAALLAKGVSGDASALPAAKALSMATINGAKALGLDHITGSLQSGKSADLISIDMRSMNTQPLYDVLSQIVYATQREQINDVWVAGRHVMKDKHLKTIDMHSLNAKVHAWRNKIAAER